MSFCPRCGQLVQEDVVYCPNCGAPITQQPQGSQPTSLSHALTRAEEHVQKVGPSIKVGVSGFLVAVILNLISPVYLYFIPSFLATILVIYLLRLESLKDGLIASFITYIFTDATLNTMVSLSFYLANEPYTFIVNMEAVLSPIISAVTAFLASYIGVWLVQKAEKAKDTDTMLH